MAKNGKREAVLQALQAKAGLFGKKKMVVLGKEKAARRHNMRWSPRRSHRLGLQELSRAVEDGTLGT